MRKALEKLQNETGATMAFALGIFLIVSILSLTMISASLTAIQSEGTQRREEQSFLTVTSAAGLLLEMIDSDGTDDRCIQRVEVSGTTEGEDDPNKSEDSYSVAAAEDSFLLDQLLDMLNKGHSVRTLVMVCGDDKICDVTVRLALADNNHLTATLSGADGEHTMTVGFQYAQAVEYNMEFSPYEKTVGGITRTYYDKLQTKTTKMWWHVEKVE